MLLKPDELISMLHSVFPVIQGDKQLALLVDIPSNSKHDTVDWQERRRLASEWYKILDNHQQALGLAISLFAYPEVGANNADLPDTLYKINGNIPDSSKELDAAGEKADLDNVFSGHQLFIAMTQKSATAPLKIAAKRYKFRAATMPGFNKKMAPALKLDFNLINERLQLIKEKLDFASRVKTVFVVDDDKRYQVFFDLFQRTAHVSSGRFEQPGTAGNFPSGETYIVPYEGGLGTVSGSIGYLPVQFGDEVVIYRIRQNKITKVITDGKMSKKERDYVKSEPAYANVAELGFGVLADFGIKPIGEILLDEKLAFHIAFGRSDHFGGIVGPEQFTSPEAVVHIDRIYLPETQPRIRVALIEFEYPEGKKEKIMINGRYQLW